MAESKSMYPANGRVILHIDMNAFYCSVHAAHEPEKYRGKPIAVGGREQERRGILVTASYECRAKGVKTGMTIWQARRLCPEIIIIHPDFDLYRDYSRRMISILHDVTDRVEQASIDEAYLDITDCYQQGTPVEIALGIQKRIYRELSLPSSVGIAPNKWLAKMASDMKKPNAYTILRKRDLPGVLWPLPVGKAYGVGKKTEERLKELNIHTIGDLAHAEIDFLRMNFGVKGERLKRRVNGEDESPVNPHAHEQRKSIGHSTTLSYDVDDGKALRHVLGQLAGSLSERLRKRHVMALNIQLTIRYADWQTITRSAMTEKPVRASEDILLYADTLLEKNWSGAPVRLLGISAQKLQDDEDVKIQLDLFSFLKEAKSELEGRKI
ncbi:DNA polymerase IV [Aneurinibacillus terranovensis]|uniref:DNA polymerase IV n=1 Tax=Aneurinibacillus terranovensis TaxID=278991 RepID=UPI0004227129|nr:DNA polymerase IV [Aneurinibacillus terranovensis]